MKMKGVMCYNHFVNELDESFINEKDGKALEKYAVIMTLGRTYE